MDIDKQLAARADNQCELCKANQNLTPYEVKNVPTQNLDGYILACQTCQTQMDNPEKIEANHWRCLNESMWSEVPAVQVMAWRMLHRLKSEGWPQALLEMMYLDDATLQWAKSTELTDGDEAIIHKDSNGNILQAGDTVTLIKDLVVKGGGFTAKRGTAVRRISLVADNAAQIEGKVEGQHIVILTEFVKKQKG